MQEAWKEQTLATVRRLKDPAAAAAGELPIFQYGRQIGSMMPVTHGDVNQAAALARLKEWQLPDPSEDAGNWLTRQILNVPDRLLFWVRGLDGMPIGCVGLADFDFAASRVEVRPLVRGVPAILPGVMYDAVQALLAWTFQHSPFQTVCLKIDPENRRALRLAELSGFRDDSPGATPAAKDRGAITLTLSRAEWVSGHRPERVACQGATEPGGVASTLRKNAAA
jgi:RimJ/RimL family protein N-acetyltransferase